MFFIGQCSNLFSRAAPDEAHQKEKPTFAKAMVGGVGMTGFEPAAFPPRVGRATVKKNATLIEQHCKIKMPTIA